MRMHFIAYWPFHLDPIILLQTLQVAGHSAPRRRVHPKKDVAPAVLKANWSVAPILPPATNESSQLSSNVT
jgi:hypothetical protein